MGREVKRVALNFEWPIRKTWIGFINPHESATNCPHCKGRGDSPEAKVMFDQWYGKVPFKPADRGSKPLEATHPIIITRATRNFSESPAHYISIEMEAQRLASLFNSQWCHHLNDDDVKALIEGERLKDFTHTYVAGEGWLPKPDFVMPTAKEVNDWSLNGMGHDSINQWLCIKARCLKEGVSDDCTYCEGEGHFWESKELQELHESWVNYEPPKGEGYQIWETVSEGSPVSPVFGFPESLASWMAYNSDGLDADVSYNRWLLFIKKEGCAMSMVMTEKGVISGVNF